MKQNPISVYGYTSIMVGAIIELIGLISDAVLALPGNVRSAQGFELTQSNPGHMLFIGVGFSLIIIGLWLCISSRSMIFHWKSGVTLTVASIAISFGISNAAPIQSAHNQGHTEAVNKNEITHTHGNEIKMSWGQLQEIDEMLGNTKAATEKYMDVSLAIADGYMQEGPSRPGQGAHFINRKILDAGVFDPTHPTFLLYEHKPDWNFELVGVGWLLPKKYGDDTPPPYFAPIAAWHYHEYSPPGICIWKDGTTNPYDETACTAAGGKFWRESPWMLHAWLFRENPEGIFSLMNSSVGGIQYEDFSSD